MPKKREVYLLGTSADTREHKGDGRKGVGGGAAQAPTRSSQGRRGVKGRPREDSRRCRQAGPGSVLRRGPRGSTRDQPKDERQEVPLAEFHKDPPRARGPRGSATEDPGGGGGGGGG